MAPVALGLSLLLAAKRPALCQAYARGCAEVPWWGYGLLSLAYGALGWSELASDRWWTAAMWFAFSAMGALATVIPGPTRVDPPCETEYWGTGELQRNAPGTLTISFLEWLEEDAGGQGRISTP